MVSGMSGAFPIGVGASRVDSRVKGRRADRRVTGKRQGGVMVAAKLTKLTGVNRCIRVLRYWNQY